MLVVTGRHRPHEVVFLVLALTLGLAYTIGAPPPQSVAAQMWSWVVHLWAIGLLLHGGVGLVAIFLPVRYERGLRLELGSMLLGFGALIFIAILVFAYAGVAGLFGGGFCIAWATANLVRAWQIQADLKGLRGGR